VDPEINNRRVKKALQSSMMEEEHSKGLIHEGEIIFTRSDAQVGDIYSSMVILVTSLEKKFSPIS
jgi:hypothetical protein